MTSVSLVLTNLRIFLTSRKTFRSFASEHLLASSFRNKLDFEWFSNRRRTRKTVKDSTFVTLTKYNPPCLQQVTSSPRKLQERLCVSAKKQEHTFELCMVISLQQNAFKPFVPWVYGVGPTSQWDQKSWRISFFRALPCMSGWMVRQFGVRNLGVKNLATRYIQIRCPTKFYIRIPDLISGQLIQEWYHLSQ